MPALWTLLRRYLLPRHGNLLSFALWLSVVGVALGVVQLMVVLAVMTGFIELLERNYTRISSDIMVVPSWRTVSNENVPASLLRVPGVKAISATTFAQGMIFKKGVSGAVIEGIDRETTNLVTPWDEILVAPARTDLETKNPYWMWVGVQLAEKIGVKVGDSVEVMIAEGESRRMIPFVVTGLFKFGIYEHDLRSVQVDINVLRELFRRYHLEPRYKVKVEAGYSVEGVRQSIVDNLGKHVESVKIWSELHPNIFIAVNHQRRLLFLILQIIVGLAAMNVVNLLMMSTHQRKRDIAILRAMGMRFSQVLQFFVFQGAAVGLVGVGMGIVLGLVACGLIDRFQPQLLSESIYNVSQLPVRVRGSDVAWVGACGFALCVVFSFLPAFGAAASRPVNALRYE